MITHTIKKLPKNTKEIVVDITWDDIKKEYDKAFLVIHAEFTFEGFRKGKVPKELAEKHIKREDIYNQLLKTYLPELYSDIVKKENLQPLLSPKVELLEAKENTPWKLKMTIAEKPMIALNNYKDAIKKLKLEDKSKEIWVPGKDKTAPVETEESKQKKVQAVLELLLKTVSVEISPLIVEDEVNRRLARLIDDVQKLGLTMENYLKSSNLTLEQLKERYTKEIEDTYKLEFILSQIAEEEKITVDQKDLEGLFAQIKDEKELKSAKENSYFYSSVLRKQKTLDYLNSL